MDNINNREFITNDNVEMLWDVILDDDNIKGQISRDQQLTNKMRKHYIGQMKLFVEKNNVNTSLFEMNKLFIATFMNSLTPPSSYKKLDLSKISPAEENIITIEELHNDRLNNFEKTLEEKQKEFTNAMTLPTPKIPNFSDEKDKPVYQSNVQDLVNKAMEERKLELSSTNDKNTTNDWISTEETFFNNNNNNRQVSWGTNTEFPNQNSRQNIEVQISEQPEPSNMYSNMMKKLKTKEPTIDNVVENNNLDKHEINSLQEVLNDNKGELKKPFTSQDIAIQTENNINDSISLTDLNERLQKIEKSINDILLIVQKSD